MNKVMTAEQAFNVAMNEYPELYAGDSLHSAKMKYYDHVFNVIGNGYRTYDFFVTNNTINSDNFEFTKSFPLKYIQGKSLFRAFTRIDKTTNYEITYKLPELYTKEELDLRTDVFMSNKLKIIHRSVFTRILNQNTRMFWGTSSNWINHGSMSPFTFIKHVRNTFLGI